MKKVIYVFVVGFLSICFNVVAQDMDDDLFDLSLEELMNIEIVSASKKAESSFQSPLSSTVLTRDEILASGATTIEEALRLAPGMLIREETNGNYDVHIRGNDNLPPGSYTFYSENSMTLVMIDGRPVYNYANGGTFWESLPISLVDIERIELVRGPATALYGPNAVSGAINIISRKATNEQIDVRGSAQVGNKATQIFDLSVGTSLMDDRLKLRLSGNLENRNRDTDTYYAFTAGDYVPVGDQIIDYLSDEVDSTFQNTSVARKRQGVNAYVDYNVNDKVNFHFSGGLQDSEAQTVFNERTSAILSTRTLKSKYVNVRAQIHGLNLQFSHSGGVQDIMVGSENQKSLFDSDILSTNVEYDLNLGKLTLRPGFNYQSAVYTDLPYGGGEKMGYLNAERTLSNMAYFLRADYKPTEKLRVIIALRNDHYNVPDDTYLSYQFISTYNFSDKHLVRALYSKANRGPFMMDSYVDYGVGTFPYIQYLGSQNLKLADMKMAEVGYRGILSPKFSLDIEAFYNVTSDLTNFQPTFFGFDSFSLHLVFEYDQLDLVAKQTGTTFSLNYAPTSKIQLKAYATVQQTKLEDYDKIVTPIGVDLSTFSFNLPTTERMNVTHKQTPALYGGVTGNFRPMDKFNVFAGVYYIGEHTYRHDYASFEESKGEIELPGRAVVNVKASYNIYKNNSLFINARNAFNSKSAEFGFADEIGGLYLAGINLSF